MGKRIGRGPGGHMEFGETPESCAIRETEEETGLRITSVVRAEYSNDFFEDLGKHYVTLFTLTKFFQGDPVICEPEKCASWEWVPFEKIPSPLFLPLENLFQGKALEVLEKFAKMA